MDVIQTFNVNRHLESAVHNNQFCIESNGTIVSIPALIHLCHSEQGSAGFFHELNLDGLFLSAAKEKPGVQKG
jgi:hypothetical protein